MSTGIIKKASIVFLALIMAISSTSMSFYGASAQAATPPAVPGNVKAVSASYNSIKISWSAVSGAAGYAVCRYNTNTKKYDQLAVLKSTSYTDKSLITGTTYTYKAKAYKTANGKTLYGNLSGAVSAKPVLSVPGGFKAVSASYNSIMLSWSAVSGATGYVVYRYNPSKKSNDRLAVISGTSYTDKLLTTGKPYSYQVQASRTVNKSSVYGNVTGTVSAKPLPAVPGAFKVLSATQNSIKTGWNTVAGANGYEVYRRVTSSGSFSFVKAVTVTNFTDTSLTAGKTYYYQVRAYRTVSGTKMYSGFTSVLSSKTTINIKIPTTKAEILAAYTCVMNYAKTAKPAYQKKEFQSLPANDMHFSEPIVKILSSLANSFMTTEDEAETACEPKGGRMEWFPVCKSPKGCLLTDVTAIKTAACVKLANGNYKITIILNDEHNPEPYNEITGTASSNTGKIFDPISRKDIDDVLVNDSAVNQVIKNVKYDLKYFNCKAVLEYNPTTNHAVNLEQDTSVFIDIQEGKVLFISATGNAVLNDTMKVWSFKY